MNLESDRQRPESSLGFEIKCSENSLLGRKRVEKRELTVYTPGQGGNSMDIKGLVWRKGMESVLLKLEINDSHGNS